jgi:hypothetical protein
LIRVAMSHICYLFEGLTFSLWFGAFAPCRSGIDFTMPPKVAVRRIAIGRCVANCRKYALSPRPRGRFSPVGNENRGHPTTASYLCIGKSSPERQGVAGKDFSHLAEQPLVRKRGKPYTTIGDTYVPKQCLRLVR